MEKKGDDTVSDIYQGGYSSLSPSYGDLFTGYRVSAGELGAPTKPDTANQIQQVNQLLNQGIIPIEVGTLDPQIFDQIPKQHFKEIKRMAKLTGAKVSVHAPLIEPSGIDPEQRRPWDESYRELAEQQLNDVVKKSIEMDDKGGMPITIHSAGIPGIEYKITDDGKKIERMVAIDKESGKMIPLEEEEKFYPGKKGLIEKHTPEDQLRIANETSWDNSITQLIMGKERADEILKNNAVQINHLLKDLDEGRINPKIGLTPTQQQAYNHMQNAQTYLGETHKQINGIFSKAYKYGTEEQQKALAKLAENFRATLPLKPDPVKESEAMQELLLTLKQPALIPEMYVPIEDFALEHSAKTFANVAFKAFDEYKDKAPVISIENMYPGMAFSSGKEIDKLITKSRTKFVEKALSEGYGKSEAEKQADKMIGMTLDMGHLNMMRKKTLGLKEKEIKKEMLKEVEKISKHVKHVHITDNFGYGDSHLPPGMGNVPIKDILQELEKKGDMKGVRKIVEAGGWVQHFQTSPFPQSLEAMGSPLYSMQMAPSWNQAIGLQQGYSSGYGQMLPQGHFQTYGSGFSMASLPIELGGQMPGAQGSRMSGRPME